MNLRSCSIAVALLGCLTAARAADDLLLADFEGTNYVNWQAVGDAFGTGPARGTLPGQMRVDGFLGKGLVNSFAGGDKSTGTLTSASFRIERRYVSFLIGGGGYSNETCLNLLVQGQRVRTATGPNTEPGGSEQLKPSGWDVSEFSGQEAIIEIVDRRTSGWGHINVDQIVQTDRRPPVERKNVTRELLVSQRYLHLPVKTGAPMKKVEVLRDGKVERFFDIELADADADWWAFLDVAAWRNEKLVIKVNSLRDDSRALASISQGDDIKGAENLYREPLRPQLHFSARRGWNNDPNGLVFYGGEYHLFFQHNPYGWNWGNMHWGHAVSRDLVHWQEREEVLYPDSLGAMFSGSAVVDWKNTSGLGRDGQPPIVLIYTAERNPTVQCLAYSVDGGKTFSKYSGNPVVKQITPGNRDPKVYWHEPTQRWVMALYVGFDQNKDGRKTTRHTIHFLTSANLKDWTDVSEVDGFFECPDYFELPLDGDAKNRKWVLTAASSQYMVGTFDGKRFTPETAKLTGHRGKAFYAAQTFSDLPADGRRIQFGWLQAPSPGMAFNQCMTLPLEMTLRSTPEGPRLAWQPVKELESLRSSSHSSATRVLRAGETMTLLKQAAGPLEIRCEFEPGAESVVKFDLPGAPVTYDAKAQELTVNGQRAPAPLRDGRQRLIIYTDRTAFEVFASDGLTYVPMPVLAKTEKRSAEVTVTGSPVKFRALDVHELKSIWQGRSRSGQN